MKLFSTSCDTLYMGSDAPLLPRAVEQLYDRFANGDAWDLSSLICVLPGTRSARRLESLLRDRAGEQQTVLTVPQIVTVGDLPECLYQPPSPIALDFEQTLAWAHVLMEAGPEQLRPLIPQLPPSRSIGPWMELAGALRRLHEELAASLLTFADVIEHTETESENRRWQLLSDLFNRYRDQLSAAGLTDPHWARRDAAMFERCHTDKQIVLIGVSDIPDSLVEMLRVLPSDLIAMVAAPKTESRRFDEFGCVDTRSWTDQKLPLLDEQLIAAGDISDQATAVAESLAEFAKQHSPDEVTVGVTDESQVGPIEIELRGCGVSTHRHLGWTIAQTAIGRLFDLTASFLQRRSWQSLAALVRHSDVHRLVSGQLASGELTNDDWLTQLDSLLAEHFPLRIEDELAPLAAKNYPVAAQVANIIDDWLADFVDPGKAQAKSIAEWSLCLQGWLQQIYGADSEREDRSRTNMAFKSVLRLLQRFAALNDRVDVPVSGSAAIEMIAGRLAELRVSQTPQADQVEILGWLDLSLDDAPALVVAGLNHPFVPAAVTNDPFLPGTLRTQLRMADNERRFARDVYAMHLMITTRSPSAVRFIVGKTGADGSPTPPSRLIAAAGSEDIARRVRQLLGQPRKRIAVHHRWDDGPETGLLPIPRLPITGDPSELITCLSVTAFRDYLMCPYRFFLRHVLKMRPLDDATSELAANQFGDLIHGALELFGQSSDKDEGDAKEIERLLIDSLHQYSNDRFGDSVSTAVRLQITQAERRLRTVASEQAKRIAAGWRIHAVEASANPQEHNAGLDVDGLRMGLSGRFDRIDFHPQQNRWAILDYKTHGHQPEKKHLKKTDEGEVWIDLQLPLYRLMIPFLGIDADPTEVDLGYFNISEKEAETKINIAEFTEAQMRAAETLIHDCIRSIRAGKFEPTTDRVQFDDYAMILQTGVANRMLDKAEIEIGQEVEV